DALKQTDVWQYCEQKMQEEQGGPDEAVPQEAPPDGEANEMPYGQEEEPVDANLLPTSEDQELPPKKEYSATPSGSNTFVPGGVKSPKVQYKANADVRKFQAHLTSLNNENKVLRLRLSRVEREKDLVRLA